MFASSFQETGKPVTFLDNTYLSHIRDVSHFFSRVPYSGTVAGILVNESSLNM